MANREHIRIRQRYAPPCSKRRAAKRLAPGRQIVFVGCKMPVQGGWGGSRETDNPWHGPGVPDRSLGLRLGGAATGVSTVSAKVLPVADTASILECSELKMEVELMRQFVLALALFLVPVVLTGCSFAPSAKQAAAADYGSYVDAGDMHVAADKWLIDNLKDPDSRRVDWGRSGRIWVWNGLLGGGRKFGYGLAADVNAKNSFGGYTGDKHYIFFFRDGYLVGAGEVTMGGTYGFVD